MSFYQPHPTCQIMGLGDIYENVFGQKTDGYFIEVGAHDGETNSNTSCLADLGWQGVYYEPHPALAQKCRARHISTPYVIVEEKAVCTSDRPVKLYLGDAISTIVPERVEMVNQIDWFKDVGMRLDLWMYVETTKLSYWINSHLKVDVLVVDVEGSEVDVLSTYPWQYPPTMLIIETHQWSPNKEMRKDYAPIAAFIDTLNLYTVISTDQINTIWLLNTHLVQAGY